MVSKQDHCLQDLLFRHRTGSLRVDLAAVVSNHEVTRALVEWHGVPFHHVPVMPQTKTDAESRLLALVEQTGTDLVVLAREPSSSRTSPAPTTRTRSSSSPASGRTSRRTCSPGPC